VKLQITYTVTFEADYEDTGELNRLCGAGCDYLNTLVWESPLRMAMDEEPEADVTRVPAS
jgi:hypothetical protein